MAMVADQQRAEREREEALQRAAWADRENAERQARLEREALEAETNELAQMASLRMAQNERRAEQQEALQLERAIAESLAISGTADSAGSAATASAPVRPQLAAAEDEFCQICHEGPQDGNDSPLHQYCMTCNAYTHTGCARDWRKRCREGKVTGRPSEPTCPSCRGPF